MNTSITSSVDASANCSIILSANKKRQEAITCLKRLRLNGIKISHTYPNHVSTLSDKDSDQEEIQIMRKIVRLPRKFLEMNDDFKVVENKNETYPNHVSTLSGKDSDEESIPVMRKLVRLPRNFLEMNDELKVVENDNENHLKNDLFTSHVSSDLQIDDIANGLKVTIIRIAK